MAVMTNTKFIEKLREIANLPTTYYSVAGGNWAKWNGSSWNFDCVILIKSILWGWNGNKNHAHGGAIYGSNGVYDDNTEGLIARCKNISTDFSNITPGEILWMPGHVGVYIGNRQVIECTAGWESKVLYSNVDSSGRRTRNGSQIYSWKKHGKLPYIDYVASSDVSYDTKSTEELAKEVIDGKWGNGQERKDRLGSRYAEVQAKVNEILTPKVNYLSNTTYTGVSIVDALKEIGIDSSYSYRSKLAIANGITNYIGSSEQNTKLLNLLKQGKLKSA